MKYYFLSFVLLWPTIALGQSGSLVNRVKELEAEVERQRVRINKLETRIMSLLKRAGLDVEPRDTGRSAVSRKRVQALAVKAKPSRWVVHVTAIKEGGLEDLQIKLDTAKEGVRIAEAKLNLAINGELHDENEPAYYLFNDDAIGRLTRIKKRAVEDLRRIESEIKKAKNAKSATVYGVLDDGSPVKVKALNEAFEIAKTMKEGHAYVINGTRSHSYGDLEIIMSNAVLKMD